MNKYISDNNKFVADIAKEITVAVLSNNKVQIDVAVGDNIVKFYNSIFNGISKSLYATSENNKD